MRRLLIVNATAFPVLVIVMLVMTGTWSSVVVPTARDAVVAAVGADTAPPVPPHNLIETLAAADLEAQHTRLAAVRDSIREERERLVTERQELRALTDQIDADFRRVSNPDRPGDGERATERESLARIFQEMDPVEAVEVLRHLDDASVEYVVKTMQRRHAAAVLAELEPEHAARLSARILTPSRGSGEKERP